MTKLHSNQTVIRGSTTKTGSIQLEQIPKQDVSDIWDMNTSLFRLVQDTDVLVFDLKQMQNLARKFDSIIKHQVTERRSNDSS